MSEEEKKKVKKPKSKARKIIEWVLTGIFGVLFVILGIAQIDGMVHQKDHHGQTLKFGYGTFVVSTESMEPKYKVDDALITKYESFDSIYQRYLNKETIDITFYYDSSTRLGNVEPQLEENSALKECIPPAKFPIITHRVREIQFHEDVKEGQGRYVFITAGINKGVASATDDEGNIKEYQAFNETAVLGRVVVGSAVLGAIFQFVSSIWGLLILLLIPAFYLVITSVIDIFKAYKEPEEEKAGSAPSTGQNSSGAVELSEEDKKRLKEELLEEMLNKKKGDN